MKNIIICGLIGTGKTTLAKRIAKEFKYKYVDLNNIFTAGSDKIETSKYLSGKIDCLLNTMENSVIDCEYLIFPEQYALYKSRDKCEIIYLGFNNVDVKILFDKFSQEYEKKQIQYDKKKLLNTLKYFKKVSKIVYDGCLKYNFKYFDICREKDVLLEDIYQYLLNGIIIN